MVKVNDHANIEIDNEISGELWITTSDRLDTWSWWWSHFQIKYTYWCVSWIEAIMCWVGVPLVLWFTSVPSLFSRPVTYMCMRDSVNSPVFLCRNNPGLSLTFNSELHRVELSPGDRILEMLKVTRLAKIVHGFYRIRRFIIVFTRAHPWSPP
jgi:hypothetical protein